MINEFALFESQTPDHVRLENKKPIMFNRHTEKDVEAKGIKVGSKVKIEGVAGIRIVSSITGGRISAKGVSGSFSLNLVTLAK